MKLKAFFTALAATSTLSGCMEGGVDPNYITAAGAAIGYDLGRQSNHGAAGAALGALVGNSLARTVPDCRTYDNTYTRAVRDNRTGRVTYYTTEQSQNQSCTTYGRGYRPGPQAGIF